MILSFSRVVRELPLVGALSGGLLLAVACMVPSTASADEPKLVQMAKAEYPPQALRKSQSGWVELEFTVGVDGKVRDVAVVKAMPSRVFDRAAVRAMQQSSFLPARKDGKPVEARVRQKVDFQN